MFHLFLLHLFNILNFFNAFCANTTIAKPFKCITNPEPKSIYFGVLQVKELIIIISNCNTHFSLNNITVVLSFPLLHGLGQGKTVLSYLQIQWKIVRFIRSLPILLWQMVTLAQHFSVVSVVTAESACWVYAFGHLNTRCSSVHYW